MTWYTVHGTRCDLHDTHCGDTVVAGAVSGEFFGRCDEDTRRDQGVLTIGHQDGARVATLAAKVYRKRGRRSDCADHANVQTICLQNRTLLDVQFDEMVILLRREHDIRQVTLVSGLSASLLKRNTVIVAERIKCFRCDRAAH